VYGRLEHDGVAEDEGGHQLPGRNREREIPRGDRGNHPHRMPHAHRPFVRELRGNDIAELAAPLARDVVSHIDALLDIAAGFGEDLAHLASHLPSEVVLPREHDLARSIEDLATFRGGVEPPTVESAPRGIHRPVDVGYRRFRHVGDELSGRGVRVLERLTARGVEPAAVDVILECGRRHGR